MGKAWAIDLASCVGCYACQIACKDEHVGNDWSPYARPQPETGQFWMKVHETERGVLPVVSVSYFPKPCMHCKDAPCVEASRDGAVYRRPDGIVVIDPVKAKGQKQIVDSCPYGAIYWNDQFELPQKCTLCAHLLDKGWKEPRCVEACPTQALKFGEEEDLKEMISKGEVLHPEYNTNPIVHYLDMPKRYITGSVFDPKDDECMVGVRVTLVDCETKDRVETKTDGFGDFWLKGLKVEHKYSIKLEKEGYLSKEIEEITTKKDVNIGDTSLERLNR